MRKLILIWILVACSIGACVTAWDPQSNTEFDRVCAYVEEQSEASCNGLAPPIVIETKLLDAMDWWGVFVWDEPYVFVNPHSDNVEKTRIHETIHYILWYTNEGRERETCKSEYLARVWASDLTDTEYDSKWYIRYNCAKPDAAL